MIKLCNKTMLKLILDTFNRIYSENSFPQQWKTATIIAIPKPGKDHTNPLNYRPISLTSCLCKLLEKMINIRLVWFLETNNIITNIQSGFRKNRSTTDHLVQLENHFQNNIAQRKHTIAVFFDLQKAYDTAWRHGILLKLHDAGLKGNLPEFIRNFLKDRRIQVRVGNCLSDSIIVKEGIPQGSVLSCTCFMLAINDINNNIPATITSTLYVDDFTIYASGNIPHLIERRLQTAINNLVIWSNNTGFTFSISKTSSMHICRKHNCSKLAPNLTISNTPIKCVTELKFLGLKFDNSLTWKVHIQELKKSCNKTLDLLKHISHKKWGADRSSLLTLFIMLIKPKLDYGCEAYSSACKSLLETLNPIQNSAIRIATGAFRSSPIYSLHSEAGLKPLELYRENKILNFLARVYVNPTHPMHNTVTLELDDEIDYNSPKSFVSRASQMMQNYNLNFNNILIEDTIKVPPWERSNINICKDLYHINKRDVIPAELCDIFNQHIHKHANSANVFTDGSKTDNGVGQAFVVNDTIHAKKLPAFASSYTAELCAIYDAILYAKRSIDQQHITIFSDSRSSIQAIEKINASNKIVQKIVEEIHESPKHFHLCWVPSHIGVLQNERVDVAAREAVNRDNIDEMTLPRSDHKLLIKRLTWEKWKDQWANLQNNKLREIKPFAKPFNDIIKYNRVANYNNEIKNCT